jgi:hypothetical protein
MVRGNESIDASVFDPLRAGSAAMVVSQAVPDQEVGRGAGDLAGSIEVQTLVQA